MRFLRTFSDEKCSTLNVPCGCSSFPVAFLNDHGVVAVILGDKLSLNPEQGGWQAAAWSLDCELETLLLIITVLSG
jgi:hypothetical protein